MLTTFTPHSFYLALQSWNLSSIRAHLDGNVDINGVLEYGITALAFAASMGFEDGVQILLTAGATTDEEGPFSPLYLASANGHDKVVSTLLEAGATPQTNLTGDASPFVIACQEGHASIVETLLEKGHDANAQSTSNLSVLYLSASRGHSEVFFLFPSLPSLNFLTHFLLFFCFSFFPLLPLPPCLSIPTSLFLFLSQRLSVFFSKLELISTLEPPQALLPSLLLPKVATLLSLKPSKKATKTLISTRLATMGLPPFILSLDWDT